MRQMIIAAALVLAGTAHAEDKGDYRTMCGNLSKLAEVIMTHRQSGVDMSLQIETAGGNKMAEDLVIAAYEYPAYTTEDAQETTIQEFSDDQYLECIKPFR